MSPSPAHEDSNLPARRPRESSPERPVPEQPVRPPGRFQGMRFKKKPRTENDEAVSAEASTSTNVPHASGSTSPTTSSAPQTAANIVSAVPADFSLGDPLTEHRSLLWARGMAHTFTEKGTHCVTALNVAWIPQLVVGPVSISLRSDGRFGVEDPLNWPQLYSPTRPYLPFIPRRPSSTAPCAALWDSPVPSDFIRANDDPSGQAYGYLVSHRLGVLRAVVDGLDSQVRDFQRLTPAPQTPVVEEILRLQAATHNALALFALPASFRNLVNIWGRLHRCWAESWAFMRWHIATERRTLSAAGSSDEPVALESGVDGRGVVGAICTDQAIARKLYAAGVPVWYLQMRHMVGDLQLQGCPQVPFRAPVDVVQDVEVVGGDVRRRVVAGEAHLDVIAQESEALLDIEHVALPSAFGLDDEDLDEEPVGHRGKAKATQRVRALERFKPQEHELLPSRVPVWQEALRSLDPAKRCEAVVGLWFPEPEFLVTPQNKLRLLVYISNWITVRLALFSKLGRPTLYPPVTQTSWRTLLSRFPEQSDDGKQIEQGQRAPSGSSRSAARGAAQASSRSASSQSSSQSTKRKEMAQRRHQQKQAVCAYFSALLGFQQRPLTLRTEPIQRFAWRGTVFELDRAAAQADRLPVPADVIREIAWELAEIAFRVEICELDARMVPQTGARALRVRHEILSIIFPGGHWSKPDFPVPASGLAAEAVADRVETLEGLRLLLVRWPDCPVPLKTQKFEQSSTPEQIQELERDAVKFFCESAFRKFGRVAAVPRVVPGTLRATLAHAEQAPQDW